MEIIRPYLLFLGDAPDQLAAKTAAGVVDWRRDWCVGQMRLPGCGADVGLPDMDVAEAVRQGAKTFVIGVVNAGGRLPEHWIDAIVEAIGRGLDVASGMHVRLASFQRVAEAAHAHGRKLFDLRASTERFATGNGEKRPGRRVLTVGTDCSVGKKYAALALEAEMRDRGLDAEFRATGQTGVLIAGRGVAIDAVVADFIAGAAEWLSPAAAPGHWDVVEGQGSLFHPSFAGVTLGLLHGAQPDAFVVCHEPTRKTMRNVSHALPSIAQVIEATVSAGRLTNPDIRCVGVAINTSALPEAEARATLEKAAAAHGVPASDPLRFGMATIVDRLLEEFPAPR
ncbi:N-acetyltransferase DgcN [Hansschlegelia zhihuaiae]|uniref:DUF1611 domain-containing protein n=1 Tax=Hansschlegelia zhihuaiae TaxID=405005 RepID=A0A4Q0MMP2_9HYPH|nr:N-acetyltransferase DgcN [Hansschlegelia zhihuaiae]RXF74994.1 DUF1611 domain-containing protein [Hansschlegelia zhihuaiae]